MQLHALILSLHRASQLPLPQDNHNPAFESTQSGPIGEQPAVESPTRPAYERQTRRVRDQRSVHDKRRSSCSRRFVNHGSSPCQRPADAGRRSRRCSLHGGRWLTAKTGRCSKTQPVGTGDGAGWSTGAWVVNMFFCMQVPVHVRTG